MPGRYKAGSASLASDDQLRSMADELNAFHVQLTRFVNDEPTGTQQPERVEGRAEAIRAPSEHSIEPSLTDVVPPPPPASSTAETPAAADTTDLLPEVTDAHVLFQAALQGNTEAVTSILDGKPNDISYTDPETGTQAILEAAYGGHPDIVQILVQRGADVNCRNAIRGWTPLMLAAREGHHQTCTRILLEGAHVNDTDLEGKTALSYACIYGYADIAKVLLDCGADPDMADTEGRTCIHAAVNHPEVIFCLADSLATIDARGVDGRTALIEASRKTLMDSVKALLQCGANIDAQDTSKKTALMYGRCIAAELGVDELVEHLLEKGANRLLHDKQDWTALWYAVRGGHVSACIRIFDPAIMDINVQDERGWSMLMEAAYYGHREVCEWLIQRGCLTTFEDVDTGYTAVRLAANQRHHDVFKLLKAIGEESCLVTDECTKLMAFSADGDLDGVEKQLVQNLSTIGTLLSQRNHTGWTAMHFAALYGNTDVLQRLISFGAEVDSANDAGWTPLMLATRWNHGESARFLMQMGASVKYANNDELTALHCACENTDSILVGDILMCGADANAKDLDGLTPLLIAAEKGDVGICEMLIQSGADIRARDQKGNTVASIAASKRNDALRKFLLRKSMSYAHSHLSNMRTMLDSYGYSHNEQLRNAEKARVITPLPSSVPSPPPGRRSSTATSEQRSNSRLYNPRGESGSRLSFSELSDSSPMLPPSSSRPPTTTPTPKPGDSMSGRLSPRSVDRGKASPAPSPTLRTLALQRRAQSASTSRPSGPERMARGDQRAPVSPAASRIPFRRENSTGSLRRPTTAAP